MTEKNEWLSWLKVILLAIILAIGIRTFLLTPIVVDGSSMLPTLEDGDQMIVNKISYLIGEPNRFDIIVIHVAKEQNFIKRVIGLPGEHIRYDNEILYVNGEPVAEPFIAERVKKLNEASHYTHDFSLESLPEGYTIIPEGYVLVLGDNRSNSTDSRLLGLVSFEQIIGKAQFTYWPLRNFGFAK